MAKPLSLADRIALAKKANENEKDRAQEKKLIGTLAEKNDAEDSKNISDESRVRSGSGQGQVNLTLSRPNIDTISPLGHHEVRSGSGQGQVSSIGSGPVSSINTDQLPNYPLKVTLAHQQQKVYEWFIRNGFAGYFNKGIISRETGINHPTIRKAISKLETLDLINIFEYDPVSRQQKYKLNPTNEVTLLKISGQVSSIRSGSGQDVTTSYKKERKIYLNNLSFSDFWISQGLTQQKLSTWIEEFDFTDEEWQNQLIFGESEPKVKNADSPINYFYKALKKGGLTRPEGFEFPEERRQRIQAENLKARKAFLAQAEKLREQEKELADKEAFIEFLKDKESIENAMTDFADELKIRPGLRIAVAQFRKNGNIDSVLENRLKRWFRSDST